MICKVSSTNSIIYPQTFYFSSGSQKEAMDYKNVRHSFRWICEVRQLNHTGRSPSREQVVQLWAGGGGSPLDLREERETFTIITFFLTKPSTEITGQLVSEDSLLHSPDFASPLKPNPYPQSWELLLYLCSEDSVCMRALQPTSLPVSALLRNSSHPSRK